MTIIVTGAQGFIGSALVRLLESQSHQVISLSRNDLDLADSVLQERCKGATTFIHLAGRLQHLEQSDKTAPLYQNENVLLTRRLLHLAQYCGIGHFIFLSSISVNGDRTHGVAFTEDDIPAPQTPYAQSKLDAENKVISYCSEHHISWTIIRPPMVYGPHATGNVGRLQKLIARRFPLPFGMIRNTRSFISIENLCDLIAFCMHAKNARNQLYLASDGIDRSTVELVRILAKQDKTKALLFPVPVCLLKFAAWLGGNTARVAPLWLDLQINPHKIFTQLGWRPKDVR